jgi:hypothetical protein
LLVDNFVVIYRNSPDVFFFVVGSAEDNELILLSVMNGFYEACYRITRFAFLNPPTQPYKDRDMPQTNFQKKGNKINSFGSDPIFSGMLDRRSVIDNIDLVYLCLDELIDRGLKISH